MHLRLAVLHIAALSLLMPCLHVLVQTLVLAHSLVQDKIVFLVELGVAKLSGESTDSVFDCLAKYHHHQHMLLICRTSLCSQSSWE